MGQSEALWETERGTVRLRAWRSVQQSSVKWRHEQLTKRRLQLELELVQGLGQRLLRCRLSVACVHLLYYL